MITKELNKGGNYYISKTAQTHPVRIAVYVSADILLNWGELLPSAALGLFSSI